MRMSTSHFLFHVAFLTVSILWILESGLELSNHPSESVQLSFGLLHFRALKTQTWTHHKETPVSYLLLAIGTFSTGPVCYLLVCFCDKYQREGTSRHRWFSSLMMLEVSVPHDGESAAAVCQLERVRREVREWGMWACAFLPFAFYIICCPHLGQVFLSLVWSLKTSPQVCFHNLGPSNPMRLPIRIKHGSL